MIQSLRKNNVGTPVILLTEKNDLEDRVYGLDNGADDYLSKPFEMKELMARVRALIRRQPQFRNSNYLEYGDLVFYSFLLKITCNYKEIAITLKESQVLEVLLRNKNQIVSKNTLIERIWGFESNAEDNHVEVYISFLRKKLQHLDSKVLIKTKIGLGYILSTSME